MAECPGGVVMPLTYRLDYEGGYADTLCSLLKPTGYSLLRLSPDFRRRSLISGWTRKLQALQARVKDDHHQAYLVDRARLDLDVVGQRYPEDMQ